MEGSTKNKLGKFLLMISLIVLKNFSDYPGSWWQAKVQHSLEILDVIGKGDALVGIGFKTQSKSLQRYLEGLSILSPQMMKWEELLKFKKIIVRGTPFQVSVWSELLKIPIGITATYTDIAQAIGSPKALRAVGSAVGANPVSILIPCHRILPKAGGIGNYYWGSALKKKLLDLECVN